MFTSKIHITKMMSMAMPMRGEPRIDNLPMLVAA
jgi:hypothetical protein